MPAESVVLVAASLLVALVATLVVRDQRRSLSRIRAAAGTPPAGDLAGPVRELRESRERAEAGLRRSLSDRDELLDVLGAGVIRLDEHLVARSANRTAHLLLGRRPQTLTGLTPIEVFGDHRLERVIRRAHRSGEAVGELRVRGATETVLVVRARRAGDGGVWVILEDVSELRRLQRIRAEFIDNLSHELRTPLTTVRLLTETLALDLEKADAPPRIRDRVAKIDVETGHLVQMVNELLDLARIESGGASRLQLGDVDLRAVVRAAIERLGLFAERQGVTLRTDAPADLPLVRGDEDRLAQLLLNLLHNAVKFSGPSTTVTVRLQPTEAEVVVSVEDQGPGIAAADLDRVFERFYKVDRARVRGTGGTGLGLAIARHIAESHGGRIWVESEEGKGACFRVALPISPAA